MTSLPEESWITTQQWDTPVPWDCGFCLPLQLRLYMGD